MSEKEQSSGQGRRGWRFRRPRGRVLEARFGYNPNSSSLGADLTPLLLLSSVLTVAVPSLLIFFQSRTKKGEGSPVGEAGS